jgi:hypothetical protein
MGRGRKADHGERVQMMRAEPRLVAASDRRWGPLEGAENAAIQQGFCRRSRAAQGSEKKFLLRAKVASVDARDIFRVTGFLLGAKCNGVISPQPSRD